MGSVRIGLYVSTANGVSIDEILRRFIDAEACGLHTAWTEQVFEQDALTLLALAARATRRIELGSWVVPIQARHPAALAQLARTVQATSAGRLVLGVGVSHEAVIERRLGLPWARPLRLARAYLDVLWPLLETGRVDTANEAFRLRLSLDPIVDEPPTVLLAALGPRMLELAAARTHGAALWLAGPRILEEFAIPRLREAALAAGRPLPRIACGLPIAVTPATSGARVSAEAFLAQSSRLPAYRRILEREGARTPADVALVGDEEDVGRRLDALESLGVTDFNAVTFDVEGDADAALHTLALLEARARRA
jgi:F420-dependent oxidoreductase-like protein